VEGEAQSLTDKRRGGGRSTAGEQGCVVPGGTLFVPGERISVTFDDSVAYEGTVTGDGGRSQQGRRTYSVHFDDGDKADDVLEGEMCRAPLFQVGDRVSVPFEGDVYAGTVDGLTRDADGATPLIYTVSFDDGERLTDISEDEMTRLTWQGGSTKPAGMSGEALSASDALRGPKALKVNDRLRVWWHVGKCYDGVVLETNTLLDSDCQPSLAFRVAYDDGDVIRHMLGDFPFEKLPHSTRQAIQHHGPTEASLTNSPKVSHARKATWKAEVAPTRHTRVSGDLAPPPLVFQAGKKRKGVDGQRSRPLRPRAS